MRITMDRDTRYLTVTDLPALVGSPKQIAWAEDIRAKALHKDVGQPLLLKATELGKSYDDVLAAFPSIEAKFAKVFAKTSAKFWIDTRDTDIRLLADAANREG